MFQNYMLGPRIEVHEINNVQVVRAGNEGPIVLYLHHAGQPPLENKDHILPLAKLGQVFAPNMFDLVAVLKRNGIKKTTFADLVHEFYKLDLFDPRSRKHIVAASWGASFAWEDAADDSQRVASITAASATGWPIERSTIGWLGAFARDNIQKLLQVPSDLKKKDPGAGLFMQQVRRNGPGAMWYALRMTMDADAKEILPNVQSPVELLWSSGDKYVPLSGGVEMEKLLPNARLEVVSELNHLWYVFEPDKFIDPAIKQIKQSA